ncbi:MAG TPA: von Willebrand factor type A domain-containing protein [Gemmatimonadales bacterium]|nr:von Willebrand factor type A domain-containing protein [Gemmatimonadales bacterium]
MFRPQLGVAALAGALLFLPLARANPPAGILAGAVTDDAGTPIANASVVIVGTAYTALTNPKGQYIIRGVAPGTYEARAAFIGYRAMRHKDIVIRDGDTTRVNFVMTATTVELPDLTVATEQPLIPRDEVTTRQRVAGTYTAQLPVDRIDQKAAVQPGVVSSPSGNTMSVGGGRPDEAASYVDGARSAQRSAHSAPQWNTEEYSRITDNRFLAALTNPLSTFSIDVDRASYSNVRRFLANGQRPPADAVRIEELVNYFSYDYAEPEGRDPFTIAADAAPAPWNRRHQLVRIGIQGKRYQSREIPPSNLVFLIDVSGSMMSEDKLPLVKQAFHTLVRHLGEEDRVAIVVYAGQAGLVLPSTPGSDRETILSAIDRLEAGGSTAGGAGIRLAYDVAQRNFMPEGNHRVILATDGDFNVGVSSTSELTRLIEDRRKEGTYLTVLGFGTGNYKDGRMETLADKGNGNYAYIDNILEAKKVFGTELTGTLFTIAKDVKIQVEFNPSRVKAYRLIGYENRLLAKEDFNDDTKDAGELGAGHSVTALYEVVPVDSDEDFALITTDSLRYQRPSFPVDGHQSEWLTVKLRYKPPTSDNSRLLSLRLTDNQVHSRLDGDFAFAAAVAEFGMLLRDSEFKGDASWGNVRELARRGMGEDVDGLRAEFLSLVGRAAGMADRETAFRDR